MTGTPARDALEDEVRAAAARALSPWEGDPDGMGFTDSASDQVRDAVACILLDDPDVVVAALVESGWRPTADQLRAMGGEESAFDPYGRGRRLWRFPEGVDGD